MRAEARLITGVAVVVPAHNEEGSIGACLDGLLEAFSLVPPAIRTSIVVVLDRCDDRTAPLVHAHAAGAETLVDRRGRPLGSLRDRGARHAIARLARPAAQTWLLHTDADSVVPRDWVRAHLRHAELGAHAVAGLTEIADWASHDDRTRRRYERMVSELIRGDGHDHVYGANLGVRADAYLRVGGFPPLSTGEDHALWTRLNQAGCPLAKPTESPVRTSSRVRGRASGGLADLLRSISAERSRPGDAASCRGVPGRTAGS
ncbi:glycosyltransferase [Allokutzneria sp. A3M-2-11 16]|uniref:glycosyltransferase n=1 Tax=Allokutzneria sp. A3M-2-11 16 TaxID=2962043 RepID=UPI0020B6B709|nr:glycosyltransferase [Allokutzneria sp. A3M-2-11 16]MCP3803328.1 glycosyltransferase [Allokutzneria sp. A3M-2-11 16]